MLLSNMHSLRCALHRAVVFFVDPNTHTHAHKHTHARAHTYETKCRLSDRPRHRMRVTLLRGRNDIIDSPRSRIKEFSLFFFQLLPRSSEGRGTAPVWRAVSDRTQIYIYIYIFERRWNAIAFVYRIQGKWKSTRNDFRKKRNLRLAPKAFRQRWYKLHSDCKCKYSFFQRFASCLSSSLLSG